MNEPLVEALGTALCHSVLPQI